LAEKLEKKGNQYIVSNPSAEISNNNFTNNFALYNSSGIYTKEVGIVAIENNRFKDNRA